MVLPSLGVLVAFSAAARGLAPLGVVLKPGGWSARRAAVCQATVPSDGTKRRRMREA